MKICTKCLVEKPIDAFYQSKGKVQAQCKECHKAVMNPRSKQHYQNNKPYYIERNKKYLVELRNLIRSLKNVPCYDCHNTYPGYVMDFDHVRGEKVGNVSKMAHSGSPLKILAEVAKCEVVCANCHRERTHGGTRPLKGGSKK